MVAEICGRPDHSYDELLAAADRVAARMRAQPDFADVDDIREVLQPKLVFITDQEKAALNGVSVADIAETIQMSLEGASGETGCLEGERNPLRIVTRLPLALSSSAPHLARLIVKGGPGGASPRSTPPACAAGRDGPVGEDAGRSDDLPQEPGTRRVRPGGEGGTPPAECIADMLANRQDSLATLTPTSLPEGDGLRMMVKRVGNGFVFAAAARPLAGWTYFANGSGIAWSVPDGIRVDFAGEGKGISRSTCSATWDWPLAPRC